MRDSEWCVGSMGVAWFNWTQFRAGQTNDAFERREYGYGG